MLKQICSFTLPGEKTKYIKSIKMDGEIEYTDIQDEALILLNHHWSEFIKRNDLEGYRPHLVDIP